MMSRGSKVVVVAPKRQGPRFKNQVGTVLDCTRSLSRPYPLVYFVHLADLGISAWLSEDQLALQAEETPAA